MKILNHTPKNLERVTIQFSYPPGTVAKLFLHDVFGIEVAVFSGPDTIR